MYGLMDENQGAFKWVEVPVLGLNSTFDSLIVAFTSKLSWNEDVDL